MSVEERIARLEEELRDVRAQLGALLRDAELGSRRRRRQEAPTSLQVAVPADKGPRHAPTPEGAPAVCGHAIAESSRR
jgi:hypothetical protein